MYVRNPAVILIGWLIATYVCRTYEHYVCVSPPTLCQQYYVCAYVALDQSGYWERIIVLAEGGV